MAGVPQDSASAAARLREMAGGYRASQLVLLAVRLKLADHLAAGPRGASSVLFYMAVYVVMTVGSFLCVLWMRDSEGRPVEDIASLSGLAQTRPAFAAAFGWAGAFDLTSPEAIARLSNKDDTEKEVRRTIANEFRRFDAPLDTTTPVAWAGYANRALADRIGPVLAEVLRAYVDR